MEDTFRVRVGKVFGSLAGTPSSGPSSSLSSLWSLTDEEIEKREWNRDKDSPEPELELEPQPYNLNSKGDFSNELEKDLLDLDEDVEEEEEDEEQQPSESANKHKPDDYNDEEWEIKSSIGLDCTLDYEEEEDGYDKVAVGKENAGDRLYMKDVNDYGIDIDSQEEVPTSFKDFTRDPRANHLAAKIRLQQDAEAAAQIRLQEDADAAQKIVSLRVSGNNTPYAIAAEIITSEDDTNLKSILKRKTDNQLDPSKSQKAASGLIPTAKVIVMMKVREPKIFLSKLIQMKIIHLEFQIIYGILQDIHIIRLIRQVMGMRNQTSKPIWTSLIC
ncbi:hypothetical protein GBA52_028530 [Prunus armeniaca]|nr:hypothetical protein GBA52_028530 [Prunus armeniaca]